MLQKIFNSWEGAIEIDGTLYNKVAGGNGVNEYVVKGEDTAESEQSEEQVVEDIEHNVLPGELYMSGMLLEAFFFRSFFFKFCKRHNGTPFLYDALAADSLGNAVCGEEKNYAYERLDHSDNR